MTTGRQLFTTLASDGTLTVELGEVTVPEPGPNQVLVRMEAAPINPSDLALLFGPADLENAQYTPGRIVAQVPEPFASAMKGRQGQRLPVGNEGAGTVMAAGANAAALVGQRVACVPGNAYAEYVVADAAMCLPLGDLSAQQGASAFVNPMTALGFAETARAGGHQALIHAAAASNLGRMLNRICQEDGLALVNIVRSDSQVELLREAGAEHVVNSSDEDFPARLRDAIDATGAFLGFDPIGGGRLVDTCFKAMEQVAVARMGEYSRYGSNQQKTMYIYGRLDLSPTILTPSYGFGWTLSGWLLTPFLQQAGLETVMRMRERVRAGLTTTFASHYSAQVTLDDMLTRDAAMRYSRMRTGEKYLVLPNG
ncbi:NADH oxidase [Erythrobacteraceae bacterium CFH 75059]|uniref:zinc-binding dehydrogenase n=1 Tax=Qipengyuania thermophila TaxID=2509361 RepID=UPI00101EAFCF|nr:zinc-binding dehydrogenase [Qipengyuania thermophila]TCD02283.1 NADH oxidase [Erythrobacteraceae bacterium CFH 75059]